ncbi:MAG: glycosyltransferase [Lachnospiraceae bacterium]|nr:glycosyltransferase [Lachnospiraceae bacterium]
MKPILSVCIITKNERKFKKVYYGLKKDLFEIIVVDTGSNDGTQRMKANDSFAVKFQEDTRIPYVLYQLGKSYYMAAEYTKACAYFDCGLYFDLNPRLEYVIDMVETYGYALLNSGQADHALFLENIYEEFGNTADFKFLMGLIYMNNEMFEAAVEEFKKALKMPEGRARGVNSYLACYNIGVIYECLGQMTEAEQYYNRCGGYEPAEKRLENMKK